MKRGDLYRVAHPGHDPKKYRVFVVVGRQAVIDSKFSSVICAPVYSVNDGLASQVGIGIEKGLKHASSIHCDALVRISKSVLTSYVGSLPEDKLSELTQALKVALDLPD